jgi:hypothetical protein
MSEWIVIGRGHRNVRATHRSTMEFTRENFLTERGDCIVAISCNKALCDVPEDIKRHLLEGGCIEIEIECACVRDRLLAYGDSRLTFKSSVSMVVRKSSYTCDRTLAIRASKAARELKRELVRMLREGKQVSIIVRAL